MAYYKKEVDDVLKEVDSSRKGLSDKEAKLRLHRYGLNELKEVKKESWFVLLLRQFVNPLIFILIIATIISFLLGHVIDAIVILIIVVLNALLGFGQEYKVEKAIDLLKKLSSPKVTVVRNGKKKIISSTELVRGDVVILSTGDKVSADLRLIDAANLESDESVLTGESMPVSKSVAVLKGETEIGDQKNMVFSGTTIVYGRGAGVVVETGMNTELGKIAKLVQEVDVEVTPLQKKLSELSKWLGVIIVLISGLVFLAGWVKGLDSFEMFLAGISLAVSAIPEGLPAVVTITLALGVRRMLKRNALVRKIHSIETLGAVTIIASDKTGTLTKNEMTVTDIFANKKRIKVDKKGRLSEKVDISKILAISKNCNDASLNPEIGDPTEVALLKLSSFFDVKKKKREGEVPFDSDKKYMITMHSDIAYIKGAAENVLDLCKYVLENGKVKKLDAKSKKIFLEENAAMAKEALRVLGMAYEENGKRVFVGLVGMIDPPRPEVKKAIEICFEAGIRPIMITGDHRLTAEAVAHQIGISGSVLEGKDIDSMSFKELRKVVKQVNIYARVSPSHKVKILEALQANGEIVAMTGDGVNDAPSIKKANVGVAMGINGTDVARDASFIVLRDDNFASIVKAVEEGRVIYDNIKKFIKYLLSVNFAEIFLLLFTILVGLPLPLLPLQILWINLATDSLPALALGVDPAEEDVMKRKPRDPREKMMLGMLPFLALVSSLSFFSMFMVFGLAYLVLGYSLEVARTMTLSTSILFQLVFVFSIRSDSRNFYQLRSNKPMIYSVLLAWILHLVLIYSPLNSVFGLMSLGLEQWMIIACFSVTGFIAYEAKKFISRRFY